MCLIKFIFKIVWNFAQLFNMFHPIVTVSYRALNHSVQIETERRQKAEVAELIKVLLVVPLLCVLRWLGTRLYNCDE